MKINDKKYYNVFAKDTDKEEFYNFLKKIKNSATSCKMEYSQFYMEFTFVTPYGTFLYLEDDDNGIPDSIERVA